MRCEDGSLYNILFNCRSVRQLCSNLLNLESLKEFHFKTDKCSRLIFQKDIEFGKIVNFVQFSINLFILTCRYTKKKPNFKDCIKHLFYRTKLAISIDSGYVEIERLLILASDLDEEISKLDEEATNLLQ